VPSDRRRIFKFFLPQNANVKETALQQDLCCGCHAPFSLGIIALDNQLRQALTEQIRKRYLSTKGVTD